MLVQRKIGNIDSFKIENRTIDWLLLQWYEASKRIQRKRTNAGREILLKFTNENPALTQGDILYESGEFIIVVDIAPCDCLVIEPRNMFEMASVCYEIGNKHLPLFFENNSLLVPFEQPLFRMLAAQGYQIAKETRKLLQPLRTTVSPHAHANQSLFSKIMKLTTSNE
jgi:urease accessory protein